MREEAKETRSWRASISGEGPPLEQGKCVLVNVKGSTLKPFYVCVDRLPDLGDGVYDDGLYHVSASDLGGLTMLTLAHRDLHRV